ncbi:MAG: phosphoenolpyruvate synthase, partial [Planctomycetota bacterium]
RENYRPIISKKIGEKKIKMIYSPSGDPPVKNVSVEKALRNKFSITDEEILKLARWAMIIEDHYKKPMDMEWAKDGKSRKLFIVQARPETVQSRKDLSKLEEYVLKEKGEILVEGKSVGSKIGSGKVRVIMDIKKIHSFKKGEVLVTDMTDPDWEPIMKKASAIVTNKGGRTCHAAIISRELGIPAIVGTNDGTSKLKTGEKVTVSCAEGERGFVYKGLLDYEIRVHDLKKIPKSKTKIMMNVGNPEQAFEYSFIPNEGVGLAREEFIINSYIKIHPKALIKYPFIKNPKVKKEIDKLTEGYRDKKKFFIDKLAEGIGMIGAAFYPKEVIVRMSDFKSNEYANLIGGNEFEPKEENPMIGWRGASRYYSEKFKPAFGLECKA